MLQQQVADLKTNIGRIKKCAVPEWQEWVLETAYSNKHRLKGAALGNRQPAVRGRPKVSNEDAHRIMQIIMAIRGLDKKKFVKEWRGARLSVMPKKMKMQGIAHILRKAVGNRERWSEEEQGKVEEEIMPLKDILCPACGSTQKTRDIKLRVENWRCRCRRQWVKCPVHVHESLRVKGKAGIKKQQNEKERLTAKRGVDEPMPQRRGSKAEASRSFDGSNQAGNERALFKKGAVLDVRSCTF